MSKKIFTLIIALVAILIIFLIVSRFFVNRATNNLVKEKYSFSEADIATINTKFGTSLSNKDNIIKARYTLARDATMLIWLDNIENTEEFIKGCSLESADKAIGYITTVENANVEADLYTIDENKRLYIYGDKAVLLNDGYDEELVSIFAEN